ncbi:MAG TPA: hypothetical protein QF753_16130 [Victivallales bacterium]|nr:hypothetical protein [Victivallales bacterium]
MNIKCEECSNQKGTYNISSLCSGYWCKLRENPVAREIAANCKKFNPIKQSKIC